MSSYSHETAPTRFVETEGVRFAYRRFGKSGDPTLLFLKYFNASLFLKQANLFLRYGREGHGEPL